MEVDIKFDDGLWECQVTASSFESQDALASKPARLVVRGKEKIWAQFFFRSDPFIVGQKIKKFQAKKTREIR